MHTFSVSRLDGGGERYLLDGVQVGHTPAGPYLESMRVMMESVAQVLGARRVRGPNHGIDPRVLEVQEAKLVEMLQQAVRRDLVKGGCGSRNTTEMAHSLELPTITVSRVLRSMEAKGQVECQGTSEGTGNVLWWRLPGHSVEEERGV